MFILYIHTFQIPYGDEIIMGRTTAVFSRQVSLGILTKVGPPIVVSFVKPNNIHSL